ncbi:MAG TPA: hypothetical protein VFL80_04940 [Thermoanaerobaculia bacterium]|nr:hypothetical protein [Thermoanaerobaculia bacterium]
MEIYRKWGRTLRYERGVHGEALIRIAESGEAREDGARFEAAPLGEEVALPEVDSGELLAAVSGIERCIDAPLWIERLIVTAGSAEHEFGRVRWFDRIRRVHASIRIGALRALVDSADFELREIREVVPILSRAVDEERDPPPEIRLAPQVAAAVANALTDLPVPGVRLGQLSGGIDGKGQPIDHLRLGGPPWPNWFRPSYRARPQPAPMNVAVEADETPLPSVPRAVALLAPADGLRFRVLCLSDDEAFPLRFTFRRVLGVSGDRRWYPFAAGAFGSEMLIETR